MRPRGGAWRSTVRRGGAGRTQEAVQPTVNCRCQQCPLRSLGDSPPLNRTRSKSSVAVGDSPATGGGEGRGGRERSRRGRRCCSTDVRGYSGQLWLKTGALLREGPSSTASHAGHSRAPVREAPRQLPTARGALPAPPTCRSPASAPAGPVPDPRCRPPADRPVLKRLGLRTAGWVLLLLLLFFFKEKQ